MVMVCITGPSPYAQGNGDVYSIWECIVNREQSAMGSISRVFISGTSSFWFYMLVPLMAAVPIISYISDIKKSGFLELEKFRTGRVGYCVRRLAWMFAGCAATLFVGMLLFTAVLLPFFEFNDMSYYLQEEAHNQDALRYIIEFAASFMKKYLFVLMCSFLVSLLAACIIIFYNDLFFAMSMLFALLYIVRELLFTQNMFVVIIPSVVLCFLFVLMGKWSDRT